MAVERSKLVEVTRSFTFKLNVGNYESRDFFCSQKAEYLEKEAAETSARLHAFCKRQVFLAVQEYRAKRREALKGKGKVDDPGGLEPF